MSLKAWQKDLNREQLAAVTHQGAPLLVLAGAGSGKTRVLTHRAAYLIEELKMPAEAIILLTFTNKAAAEMKKRLTNGSLGFAGTFHTFGARLLRRFGQRINLANDFSIYDTGDQETVMKRVLKNLDLMGKNNRPGMFLHLISRLKNDLVSKKEFASTVVDEFSRKLLSVWREYDRLLEEAGAVDFDDLLTKTVALLSQEDFYERFKGTYRYVLVDEYQDTNRAQFVLTRLLAANPAGLTVVGDAAQAIYSFRGADFRNLTMLKEEYPNLVTVQLPRNYRSTQTILDAAYGVIMNNVNHPVLQLTAEKEVGEKVDLIETLDEKEESALAVGIAEEAIGRDEELAVLYRTNAQSRALEEALIKRRVPYRLVGGVRFYDRAEVKDLLAGLRVIQNPKDIVSWERLEKSLGKKKKSHLIDWLEKERGELIGKEPFDLLQEMEEQTDYLSRFDERDEEEAARLENIRELMAVAGEFGSLPDFLESVALIQAEELADRRAGSKPTKVTLMTIHAAKGLEFDRVIVTGLEEGLLPHSRSLLEREEIEEERRLLYVAMTRAKKKLYLTLTCSRLSYGGRHASIPSRFLSEIPGRLIHQRGSSYHYRQLTDNKPEENQPDKRRLVQDWEVEKAVKNDFAEIDAW